MGPPIEITLDLRCFLLGITFTYLISSWINVGVFLVVFWTLDIGTEIYLRSSWNKKKTAESRSGAVAATANAGHVEEGVCIKQSGKTDHAE
jgi:hypothetical protein